MRRLRTVTMLVLLGATAALLAACAPGAQLLAAPTLRLVPDGSGLARLDPPGVGSGEAVFRLVLDVTNPNPVGLRLAGLDGDLLLNERRVASARFRGGIELPAAGTGRLTLDVGVPVSGAPQLLADLAGLIAGAATSYQLDATVTVDLLGSPQQLPRATLVRGEWSTPIVVVAPSIDIALDASGLRDLGPSRARFVLALDVTNPNAIGFALSAPALELFLSGRTVASAALVTTPVPAFGSSRTLLEVDIDLAALGPVVAGQIALFATGASTLEIALNGPLVLEVPGITSFPIGASQLASGVLR